VADHRSGDTRVAAAAKEALVEGLRVHGPDTVGLGLKGGACLGLASFSHFVLGVAVPPSTGLGIASAAGFGIAAWRNRQR